MGILLGMGNEMKIVALVPAHNEAASINATVEALLRQDRRPDRIIVIADNCTDQTAAKAGGYGRYVTVVETVGNIHKKSGALNYAWREFCQDADIIISLDADTVLPSNAIGDWEKEMESTPELGGSSSKLTMQAPGILSRLQKAEFSKWVDASLKKGWTTVLVGAGCAIRNSLLKEIVASDDREGPWSYKSQVEDFELSCQVRKRGYICHTSPTVRGYTDSMRDIKSIWNQRCKWQIGTVEDLMDLGVNKLTRHDWWQQVQGIFACAVKLLWAAVLILSIAMGTFQYNVLWIILPVIFIGNDLKAASRIPHRDWKDVLLAGLLLPQELFSWLRTAWILHSWYSVGVTKLTGRRKDRWAMQYKAEGI